MPGGSSGAIRAGRAFVELFADDSALQKGLRRAEQQLKGFGASVALVGAGVTGLGAAIKAPLLAAAKTFADAGSELHDMSARTGVSVEALSALSFAAKQTGTDMETVEGGIRKMQKALEAGSEENIKAESTFAALGISVKGLIKLTPEQQFDAIAKAVGNIPNPTARAAAAMQIFGKSGTALLPLIGEMGDLTAQAKELGLVMSTKDADAADALGDSMDLVTSMTSRLSQVIGSALAPLLTEVADAMAHVIKTAIEWVQNNQAVIVTALKVGAVIAGIGTAIATAGAAFVAAGTVLGTISTAIGVVGAAIGLLLSPIGLLAAGIAGLIVYFPQLASAGGDALSWLGQQFGGVLKVAQDTFKGIADALKAGDISLAAQILWAGLKVEWLKGTAFITGLWTKFKTDIAGVMVDLGAELEKALAHAIENMKGLWGDLVISLIKGLVPLEGALGKFFGVDIGKALQDAVAQAATASTSSTAAEEAAGKVSEIEARRKEARKALADEAAGGAGEALKAAQDELAALLGQASKEAAATPKFGGSKPGEQPEFTPEALDQSLGKAREKAKVDVAGSFSAAALKGLGVGSSIQDEQLKEQKKSNDHLASLNKTIDKKKAVFT